MTKSHLLAAIAGCLLVVGLVVFTAPAQVANRPVAPSQAGVPRIAMLDVSYVFKNHTGFKARTASMQAEVNQARDRMKQEEETLRKNLTDLQDPEQFKPGSPEYKQLEEMVARRRADLEVQLRLQNKEFAIKESEIYHAVYQEIEQEVGYFATQNGISAVLRFNGDPVKGGNPNEVLRNVNKQVIWFAQGLDITPDVLQRLNQKWNGIERPPRWAESRDPAACRIPTSEGKIALVPHFN